MYDFAEEAPPKFAALLRGDHPRFPSSYVREVGLEFVRGEWRAWCTTGWHDNGRIHCIHLDRPGPPFHEFAERLKKDHEFSDENALLIARQLCAQVDQQLIEAGFDLPPSGGPALH